MAHQVSPNNQLNVVEQEQGKTRSRPSSPNAHQDSKNGKSKSESDHIIESSSSCLPCKAGNHCDASTSTNTTTTTTINATSNSAEETGRERLKRHRVEMSGRVWIPDIWGQEDFLKDWIDCSAFDACLGPNGLMSARASLIEEGRRATSGGLRIENRC